MFIHLACHANILLQKRQIIGDRDKVFYKGFLQINVLFVIYINFFDKNKKSQYL